MELKKLVELVVKYRYFLMVSCILTIAVSSIVAFNIKNVYKASSLMMISNQDGNRSGSGLSYSEYTLNVSLADSYSILCKTDYILSKVIEKTGLQLSTDQLAAKIIVKTEDNTDIIRISVTDENPNQAALIANRTAEVFEQEIPSIMQMDNIQVIDIAEVPNSPVAPNRMVIVLLSLMGCLIVSALAIWLIEYFDMSVKTEEQLEDILKVPVICSLPHEKTVGEYTERLSR